MSEPEHDHEHHEHHEGETYEDSKEMTAEFLALLEKYDNDWDKAAAAQRRGEHATPHRSGDSTMP